MISDDKTKLDYKNMIFFDDIVKYLNVTPNYLGKLFNSCSLMKKRVYTIEHLRFVVENVEIGNVRKLVLIKNLKNFIEEYEKTI